MVGQVDTTEACCFSFPFVLCVNGEETVSCHELLSHAVCVLLLLNVQQPPRHTIDTDAGRAGVVGY